MPIQPSLWDEHGRARRSDPQTAKDAGEGVNAARLEQAVIVALIKGGPMTTFQIAEAVGVHWNSISPRLAPLEKRGYVERTGEKRIVIGHKASEVWRIASTSQNGGAAENKTERREDDQSKLRIDPAINDRARPGGDAIHRG